MFSPEVFAFNVELPSAILLDPVVFVYSALEPIPILSIPEEVDFKAFEPTAVFEVPEVAWDEFYTTAINLGFEKFKIWVDVISEYERIGEHMGENIDDEEDYQLEEIYMKAYTKTEEYMSHLFGSEANYQLGMDWEARAVVNWIESYPKVKETYERGDGVIMVASF